MTPSENGRSATDADAEVEEKKEELKAGPLLKRFWTWMRPHLRLVWVVLVIQLIATPIALFVPLLIRHVVDQALQGDGAADMVWWGLVIVAMGVGGVALSLLAGWCLTLFRARVLKEIRLRLFRHIEQRT